jgi:hypothetical protein
MLKLNLSRRIYVLLVTLACATPIALVFISLALGVPTSTSSSDDILYAAVGGLVASVFTYPTGVIGTIVSYATVYAGLLTPTEAPLFAAPFYIGAGYFQWYVLIPRHFRAS